jgi:AAHS family 4-hydroxybenzoate transporter-like MFS transporter
MALAWSVDRTLLVSAVPTVLAAVAVGSLGRLHERRVKLIPASGEKVPVRHGTSNPLDKQA